MARPKLAYRPLERGDMDSFEALLEHREMPQSAHERRVLVEYAAFENPLAKEGQPTYYVAVDKNDGRVLGYMGTMPSQYILDGKIIDTAVPHDLFVHPEVRRVGLGFFVTTKFYKLVEAQCKMVFPLIWTSPINRDLQTTRKTYRETGGGRRMSRVMKAASQLHRVREKLPALAFAEGAVGDMLAFAADQALGLFDIGTSALLSGKLEAFEIERFDERFDELADATREQVKVMPYKPASVLNWKYIDRPFNKKTCYAVEADGKVRGWIVVGKRAIKGQPTGAIVDFLCAPFDEDALSALLSQAIKHFRSTDAVLIEALVSDPRYVRLFKRHLFVEGETKEYFLVGGIGQFEGQGEDWAKNPDNWHISYGDTDGFLFSW